MHNVEYNIVDFGAVADGTTDNSIYIQRALNSASNQGKGTVIIPIGLFGIGTANPIMVPSNVNLIGKGTGSILKILNNQVGGNPLQIVNATNVRMADFLLEGNRVNSPNTNYGLYVSTSSNCVVESITSQNWAGVGVHVYNCDAVVTKDCVSQGNMYHGFEAEQNRGCKYQNNRGTNNDLHGLLISPGEVSGTGSIGNSFIGNSFDSNKQYGIGSNAANGDISAWLNKGNLIQGNSVYGNLQYGIQMYKQDDSIISGNFVYNNKFFGIYIYQSQNNVINGNILMNNSQIGAGMYDEIMLEGYNDNNAHPSSMNTITSNTIIMSGVKARYGINESSSGDGPNVLVNNTIPNAGTSGSISQKNPSSVVSSPGGVLQIGDNGQAISGPNAGLDAAFSHVLRIFNNFTSGETQLVNPNGPFTAYVGGAKRFDIETNGSVRISAPNSAPTLPDNSSVSLYLDEVGNNLKFAVKYSSGTTKTGTIAVV